MESTIAIWVNPEDFTNFNEVLSILKKLDIENNYKFNPSDFVISKTFISNYYQINIPISEFLKLEYSIRKNS